MSGKSIPVLKRRLKEKSDALKQCEEDVNNLVKERRKGSDSFLVSQGEIITEVVQKFDQLASVLTRKRDQLLLHLKEEMKELHASSSAKDCEEVEQLQEKLKKCLKESQELEEVESKSAFLSKYSSISQCSENLLTDVLLLLEEEESLCGSDKRKYKFSLNLDLSEALRISESLTASISLLPPSEMNLVDVQKETSAVPPQSPALAHHRRECVPLTVECEQLASLKSTAASKTGSIPSTGNVTGNTRSHSRDTRNEFSSEGTSYVSSHSDQTSMKPQLKHISLKINSKLKVLVTEVHSVNEFWVQPLSRDLEVMSAKMRNHFNQFQSHRETFSSLKPPSKGSFVAAQFTYDNEWYRAKVMDIAQPNPHANTLVKVFYVDYGNQEILPISRLQPLPPQFCALPTQAVCCCLEEAPPGAISDQALEWFRTSVPEQAGVIQVLECATLFSCIVRFQILSSQVPGVDQAIMKKFSGIDHISVLDIMTEMSTRTSSPKCCSKDKPGGSNCGSDSGCVSSTTGRDSHATHGCSLQVSSTIEVQPCGEEGLCEEPELKSSSSQEPVKKTLDQPSQEPEKNTLDQPSQEPEKKTLDQPSQEPVKKTLEQPSQEPVKKTLEQPRQEPVKKTLEQPRQEPVKKTLEQPRQEPEKKTLEQPRQEPVLVEELEDIFNHSFPVGLAEDFDKDQKVSSLSDFDSSVDLSSSSVFEELSSTPLEETSRISSLFTREISLEDKGDQSPLLSGDSPSGTPPLNTTPTYPSLHDAKVIEVSVNKGGFPVVVASVTSPSLFYAHTPSATAKLNVLQTKLDEYYNNPPPQFAAEKSGCMAVLGEGSLCAARFSPGVDTWYRGVIADRRVVDVSSRYSPEKEKVDYQVHFLDYGDAHWVSGEDVFPLLEEFLNVPILAVRLGLVGILPFIPPEDGDSEMETKSDVPKGWTMVLSKKTKKKTRTLASNPASLKLCPAGDEGDEDISSFQLSSPSDTKLQGRLSDGQTLPRPSSAPDMTTLDKSSASSQSDIHNLLDGSVENEESSMWPSEAIELFTELVQDKVLYAVVLDEDVSSFGGEGDVIHFSSVTDVLPVKLYDTSGQKDVLINAVMLEKGAARIDDKSLSLGTSGPHSTSLSPTLDDWDPIKNHFFAQSSDFHRVLQAEEEKVFQICRNYNSRHGCRYGNRCRFLHAPMGLSSERRTWEITSHDIHMMPSLPKPKSWVAVEVITVINPCLFYVHFPAGPASLLSTTKPLEENGDTWTLQQLTEDMNTHYVKTSYDQSVGSLPAKGEMVAVHYHGDGKWYRGRVLDTNNKDNRVEVFYVDFGNSEVVPESCVRGLLPKFLHLSFQAVECQLAGTTLPEGSFEGESPYELAIDAFSNLVKDKILVAFVVSVPSSGQCPHSIELELYDTTEPESDVCINRLLLDRGFLTSLHIGRDVSQQKSSSKIPFKHIPG